jgi:titin
VANPAATSYSDITVVANTSYWYRVFAYNANGDSPASNVLSVTTPAPAPGAPSVLTATAVSATQVNLSWTPGAGPITGYRIERSPDGTTWPGTSFALANPAATTYSDNTVVANTSYWYRVFAINATGDSPASNTASVTTPAVGGPAAPSGLRLTRTGGGTVIIVNWTDNSTNETGFYIERSTNGTTFIRRATQGRNSQGYQDRGLTPATKYWYRVQSYNGTGVSAYTAIVSDPL